MLPSLVPSTAREELMLLRAEKGPDGYLDAVWHERYPYEQAPSRGAWPFRRLEFEQGLKVIER